MTKFNEDTVVQIMDDLSDEVVRLAQTKIATWVASGISEEDISAALYLTFDAMNQGFSAELKDDFKAEVENLLK